MLDHKVMYVVLAIGSACLALIALGHRVAAQIAEPEAPFSYAGTVVDKQGRPVAGVEVTATHRDVGGDGYGYIATTETDAHGHFAVERAVALSGATSGAVSEDTVRLEFRHRMYAYAYLEDLQTLGREQTSRLAITLRDGRPVKGRVADAERRAVRGALVEVTFGERYELRRGTVSDANGDFELHGLPGLDGEIRVLTTEPNQAMLSASEELDARRRDLGDITLATVKLPAGSTVHELFGMKLLDVDAATQRQFHLPRLGGVLVLDPGAESRRLKIGEIRRGDQFWIVGDKPVEGFDDFKARLSAAARSGAKVVCVVYNFSRADSAGTNTQHLELNDADIDVLSR